MQLQFYGKYKLLVNRADTELVVAETPWFDNLITDAGLNAMGNGFNSVCFVGSGTATPTVADTQLQSQLARSSGIGTRSNGVQITTEPYYGRLIRSYTFAIGAVVGTVREVGIGVGNPTPTMLFSRALLMDEFGATTELTLTDMDRLTVFYEFRQCIPTGDVETQIEVNGVTQDCLVRAAFIDERAAWGADYEAGMVIPGYVALGPNPVGTVQAPVEAFIGGDSGTTPPYVGELGHQPSGWRTRASSHATLAYVNGSLRRDWYALWGTERGTITINAIRLYCEKYSILGSNYAHPCGTWQFSLIPGVSKTDLQNFRINGEFTWARCVV